MREKLNQFIFALLFISTLSISLGLGFMNMINSFSRDIMMFEYDHE